MAGFAWIVSLASLGWFGSIAELGSLGWFGSIGGLGVGVGAI